MLALILAGLAPRPVPVETAMVKRETLRVTIDEEGRTRVKHRYVVTATAAGHLRRIELKAGAIVESGTTVLATLETGGADLLDARNLALAKARVLAAEALRDQAGAMLERARANSALSQTERERARELFSRGGISSQENDVSIARARLATEDARAAEFGLRVAGHELDQARAFLTRDVTGVPATDPTLAITSPISGRVLRVFQESARNVSAGTPLLEVGDPADLEVLVEVLSRDGVAIAPGAKVLLEQWGGEKPLEARVRLVEPSAFTKISALGVEEQRVNVIADLIDSPAAHPTLGDAYRVEARIVLWEQTGVLTVPGGALFQRLGKWSVFIVSSGRAHIREVEIGHSNGIITEIIRGLEEGSVVVVFPGDGVSDGSRVARSTASG